MPKGWKQAYKGHSGPDGVDFTCPSCGEEFRKGIQDVALIKMRRLSGQEIYYRGICPECGESCREELDETPPEPASKKPTKPFKKHGQTIMIHGRSRTVIPADLEEVLEQEARLRQEKEDEDG